MRVANKSNSKEEALGYTNVYSSGFQSGGGQLADIPHM